MIDHELAGQQRADVVGLMAQAGDVGDASVATMMASACHDIGYWPQIMWHATAARWYRRAVAPQWTESSAKHGVQRPDLAYAIAHAGYARLLPGQSIDDGQAWLYIGHPHSQTDREVEVLVTVYGDGREARIFHAMELGP